MRLRRAPANPGAEMTILEHVAELRDRLIKSFAALLVTTLVAAFVLYDRTFSFITHSYCEIPARYRITTAAGQGCGLLAQSPLEGIGIRIRLSLVLGLLFAGGVAIAFVTMPKAIGFLVAAGGKGLINFYAADRYLRFVLFMGVAFGLSFEFPMVLVFLSMAGVLSSAAMLRAWRPAVALIIVAAAVITPSQDPFSLFAMAIPMWIFYFAAAGVARFLIEPWRRRRQAELMQGS